MNIRSRIYYNIFTIVCQYPKRHFRKKKGRAERAKDQKLQKSGQKSETTKKLAKKSPKIHIKKAV